MKWAVTPRTVGDSGKEWLREVGMWRRPDLLPARLRLPPPPVLSHVWTTLSRLQNRVLNLGSVDSWKLYEKNTPAFFSGEKTPGLRHQDF